MLRVSRFFFIDRPDNRVERLFLPSSIIIHSLWIFLYLITGVEEAAVTPAEL
jgi:hypothetical protein